MLLSSVSTEVVFDFRRNTEFFVQYSEFRGIVTLNFHRIPYTLHGHTRYPPELHLDVSTLQRPLVHLDETPLLGPGCTWAYLDNKSLCSWTQLHNRSLCCSWT